MIFLQRIKIVALVRPDVPADFPLGRMKSTLPLGLLVIAGCLREAGYEVYIIDDNLDRKGPSWVLSQVRALQADVVGITVNLATVQSASEIYAVLKDEPVPVFIGGPEVTANLEYVLEKIGSPFAIQGEGEVTTVELLRELFGDRQFQHVLGLTYWDEQQFKFVTNDRRPWIDMDSIPLIPYDLIPMHRYDRSYSEFSANKVEVLNTSRGCPFSCTFCSNKFVWSRRYRAMSPQQMVNHVRHALAATDATAIYFREDNFTFDHSRVTSFCDLVLELGMQFEWGCESRVDQLSPSLVEKMHQAGLRSMWFGVESGSNEVLQRLKKGITVDQIAEATRICRDAGIKVGFSVMIGVPGETQENLRMTKEMIFSLKPDWVYFAAFVGLPGSDLYNYLEDNEQLIFRRWHTLILPHCSYMSYSEKLRLKQRLEIQFNLQPRILFGHMKRIGLKRFIIKAMANSLRIIRTRFNRFNI